MILPFGLRIKGAFSKINRSRYLFIIGDLFLVKYHNSRSISNEMFAQLTNYYGMKNLLLIKLEQDKLSKRKKCHNLAFSIFFS